jgi:Zn-dependent protease with chaperone function
MQRLPAILCLIASVVCCPGVRAQDNGFTPAGENPALLAKLFTQYQDRYKEHLSQLPSGNKKDYVEIYNERWKDIQARFDKQEIWTASDAQEYLDGMVGVVVKANPQLQSYPFHCYFSRSYVPNAAYIGEGIILFNMGLFDRLADESQAAFILCHEISHYYLRHQEKAIDKYVTTINSPEVQAKLRKIKGSAFRQGEQVQGLVMGLAFDSRRHSRDHESEADSMAVVLMYHTGWALAGATSALAMLDSVDKDGFDLEGYLPKAFNAGDYPFRKKWMAREEGLLGGHARLKAADQDGLADSLKTHPDCALRVRLVGPMVRAAFAEASAANGPAGGRAFLTDSVKFGQLQERCRYEIIEYAFVNDEYTESLWLALELLQRRPADVYAVAQVGRVMNGLYQAQKGHTLGRVVDMPAPFYPENYNVLLQFVQNLYLEEVASISYYFLKAHHPEMDRYALFRKSFEESARIRAEAE